MKFYLDNDKTACLEMDGQRTLLASFLELDIQGGEGAVKLFLTVCKDVMNGSIPEWEGTGNAHTVTIKPDNVEIYNEYTDESIKLSSIAEFEWYLKQWEKLITTGEEFTVESPFK